MPDPYRQYWSSYVGMGNNPTNLVDPDGGCADGNGNNVPCPDGAHPNAIILSDVIINGNVSFDADVNQYQYSGTFDQYQQDYSQFAGMSQSAAQTLWEQNHSEAFYSEWAQRAAYEKGQQAVAKLKFFIEGFTTAGAMGMGALGGGSLATPNQFGYSIRGYTPKLNISQQQAWQKFGKHYKEYGLRHGSEGLKQYIKMAEQTYRNPSIKHTFSNSSNFYRGETWRISNGNILRTDPSGNFRSMYRIK